MAIIANITDKLRGMQMPYAQLFNTFLSNEERKRILHFQRLYDYYSGDTVAIKKYISEAMTAKQFKPETIQKMQIPHIDVVKKIINRTSLAYKEPAERYLVEEGPNNNYQLMLELSNVNMQAKTWNRLARLLDTVYVAPVWLEPMGCVCYDIFPPHSIVIQEDPKNYLEPMSIIYQTERDGKTAFVYWSVAENYLLDSEGKKMMAPENPSGMNPYGILPFVPCRLKPCDNHWGEGDTLLVDLAEKISVLLASTLQNAIMQSHGIGVGVNLGKKGELKIGPDWMIEVDDVRKDSVQPSLSFAQPSPATEECLKMIDWMLKMAAVERGLPADSVSIEVTAQSGAAKAIDNFELMEIREDDIEALRKFEKKLFDVTRVVWNYHRPEQIAEGTFVCDFAPITSPVSEKEEIEVKEKKYGLGLWTPVDDLIDEDEGIDEVKAKETVLANLALKKEFDSVNAPMVEPETDEIKAEKQKMETMKQEEMKKKEMSKGKEMEMK